tara:strand:+ start:459 stop:938 length:480 start_codon:yes stop_codon:yes gene_type:complete
MSKADILFQYHSTTTNTTTSEAELAFQAPPNGVTMINSVFITSPAAGTNTYRVHHCSEDEEPHASNVILYGRSTASGSLDTQTKGVKIILNPGDRIFCQLHSGSGITITGYGLIPLPQEARPAAAVEGLMNLPPVVGETIVDSSASPTPFNQGTKGRTY